MEGLGSWEKDREQHGGKGLIDLEFRSSFAELMLSSAQVTRYASSRTVVTTVRYLPKVDSIFPSPW